MLHSHELLAANSSNGDYELANECVRFAGKNFSHITNIFI